MKAIIRTIEGAGLSWMVGTEYDNSHVRTGLGSRNPNEKLPGSLRVGFMAEVGDNIRRYRAVESPTPGAALTEAWNGWCNTSPSNTRGAKA